MDFLALRTAALQRHKEWHKGGDTSLSYKGNELAGEVGEACNIIKKIERAQIGSVGTRASPQELAEELADVVICVDVIAGAMDIDLGEAVRAKFGKTSEKYGLSTQIDGLYVVWSAALQGWAGDALAKTTAPSAATAHRFALADALALCTTTGTLPVPASVAALLEAQRVSPRCDTRCGSA